MFSGPSAASFPLTYGHMHLLMHSLTSYGIVHFVPLKMSVEGFKSSKLAKKKITSFLFNVNADSNKNRSQLKPKYA